MSSLRALFSYGSFRRRSGQSHQSVPGNLDIDLIHLTNEVIKPKEESKAWTFENGRMQFKNSQNVLVDKLEKLYHTSLFSDVTLSAGSLLIKAHKVILAASSDYFSAMFSSAWSPADGIVALKGVTPYGLEAVTDYAYTGGIKLTEEIARDVLEAGRHCLMPAITDLCEIYLREEVKVNAQNFLIMFQLAKDYDLKNILEECEPFFKSGILNLENYLDVLEFAHLKDCEQIIERVGAFILQSLDYFLTSGDVRLFHLLKFENLKMMLLESNRHGFFTDFALIEFLTHWVAFDEDARLPVFKDLFKMVNLLGFELDELDTLPQLPYIKECEHCAIHIAEARDYLSNIEIHERSADLFLMTVHGMDLELRSLVDSTKTAMRKLLCFPGIIKDKGVSVAYHDKCVYFSMPGFCDRGGAAACVSLAEDTAETYWIRFDPIRNIWKALASLPGARYQNSLAVVNQAIFTIGGKSMTNQELNLVECYDIAEGRWSSCPDLPFSCSNHLAAALEGYIYVSFAKPGNKILLRDFFRYQPGLKIWSKRAMVPLRYDMRYEDMTSCRGRLYLIGGSWGVNDHPCIKANCYNPETDQWSFLRQEHNYGLFTNIRVLQGADVLFLVACFNEKRDEAGRTGLFALDPVSKDLLLKQSFYEEFNKDGATFFLTKIPKRVIQTIQLAMT